MPLSSNPLPPTPLGSFEDSAVTWTTWVTLMGFVGVTALSLLCAGPAARRVNAGTLTAVTRRLARAAVALGILGLPAVFVTVVWMMHLIGGAVWLGGVAGLALLTAPGAIGRTDVRAFWSPTIRRFSAVAMGCVAAVTLSGVFLYWEHVDGPSQLFTTMYGRVLGVKILIFGALLALGPGARRDRAAWRQFAEAAAEGGHDFDLDAGHPRDPGRYRGDGRRVLDLRTHRTPLPT